MKQINVFQKGISSDNDFSYQPNSTWTFPTKNIRILNKTGEGFIITPINGTLTDEDKKIQGGATVIAAESHRGIIYMVSVFELGGLTYTELGTYPSLKNYTTTNTEFEDVYKPLKNYNGGFSDFVTPKFNYNIVSKLKLIIDDSFDESANLYLCDGVNIDKIINCGFKHTGQTNDVVYSEDNFDNILNHVPITDRPPIIETAEVISGGNFKPGNYFFYLKYQTERFDSTDWIIGISPIQVGIGNTAFNASGLSDKGLNNEQNRTSSAVKLTFDISSLDPSYTFLKIGVVRYFSHNSDFQQPDVWEIFNSYKISDIITLNGEIIISGDEEEMILSLGRILSNTIAERISNDHIFLDGRMWKAGMSRNKFNHDALVEYASKIKIGSQKEDLTNFDSKDYDQLGKDLKEMSNSDMFGYQDSDTTLNKLGYFGGEIYPFVMIAQLTDGSYTEGYPIEGSDGLNLASLINGISGKNDKGLYRFPYTAYKEWIYPTFDFTEANTYYNNNLSDFKDVKYIYIARADKIKNRLYTGLTTKTVRAINTPAAIELVSNVTIKDHEHREPTGFSIPAFFYQNTAMGEDNESGHFLPSGTFAPSQSVKWSYTNSLTRPTGIGPNESNSFNYLFKDYNKIALFTPDQCLRHSDLIGDGDDLWVRIHGKLQMNTVYSQRYQYKYYGVKLPDEHRWTLPRMNMIDIMNVTESDDHMTVMGFPIQKATYKATNFFTSYLGDGTTDTQLGFKIQHGTGSNPKTSYSRSYVTAPYIGLVIDNSSDPIRKDDMPYERIITVYQKENNAEFFISKIQSYSPEVQNYSIISEPLDLSISQSNLKLSKGDNFKMRFFVRAAHWVGLDNNEDNNWLGQDYFTGNTRVHYEYGLTIGFIADSSVNIAMRNRVEASNESSYSKYTFFPRSMTNLTYDAFTFLSRENSEAVEALQINHGYEQILDKKSKLGVDPKIPIDDVYKPTKIIFSAKNIIEGIFNNYRYLPVSNQQVFRTDAGQILRIDENYGELFSFRTRGIFRHFIGQTKLTEDVTLEDDSIYLSDKDKQAFYYGIKDWHALVKSSNAIYGVDREDMLIWRVITKYTSSGSRVPQVESMSREMFIDSQMQKIGSELNPEFTTPIANNGIGGGHNSNLNEIYFTFFNDGYHETIVFNERLAQFIGTFNYPAGIFINNNSSLFLTPSMNEHSYYLWQADVNLNGSIIFGKEYDNQITIVVNGSGDEKSNSRLFTKIYGALEIDCPEKVFKTIKYTTESSEATYTFQHNSPSFWKNSEWAEGKWLVPVITDDDESEFRFVWMTITLTFQQGSDFYIRKIISDFDISTV